MWLVFKAASPKLPALLSPCCLCKPWVTLLSISGRTVAVASGDGSVKVLYLELGQLSSLRGHGEEEVHSVAFDHKARRLLSGGADGTLCLWT